MKVCVLFCLHPNDAFERLDNFLEALKSFPSQKAPVFILCKNDNGASHYDQAISLIQRYESPVQISEVTSGGFDLGTYRNFMMNSDFEIFVLLSSSSRPTTTNWVEKLVNPIVENRAVIAGSMVSAESLSSNFPIDLTLGVLRRAKNLKEWLPNSFLQISILRLMGYLLLPIYFIIRPTYSWKRQFCIKRFPNVHLRTTGIAVTKLHYLNKVRVEPKDKIDTFLLESGKNGLSAIDKNSDRRPHLITSSSEYRIDAQFEENFRRISSATPIIIDKHFEDFIVSKHKVQRFLERRTWGRD